MDQKNLLLAIVFSVAIMLGWQFYLAETTPPPERSNTADSSRKDPSNADLPNIPTTKDFRDESATPDLSTPNQSLTTSGLSEKKAIGSVPRVKVDSAKVTGSISLVGARFDDLTLRDYRETIEPDSPQVSLLKPFGTNNSYYAYYGWVSEDTEVPRSVRSGPRIETNLHRKNQ